MSYQSIVPGSSSSSSSPLLKSSKSVCISNEDCIWFAERPMTYFERFSMFIFMGLFGLFMGILIILNMQGYNDSDKGKDERDVDIMVGLGFGITGVYTLLAFYLIYQRFARD